MGWKAFFQNLIQTIVGSLAGAAGGKLVEKIGVKSAVGKNGKTPT